MKVEAGDIKDSGSFLVSGRKVLMMLDQFGGDLKLSFPHGKGRFGPNNIVNILDPAAVSHVELHDLEIAQEGDALMMRPVSGHYTRGTTRGDFEAQIAASAAQVRQFMTNNDACWEWNNHAHVALLASGKLSNCYYNMSVLQTDWNVQRSAAWGLWRALLLSMGQVVNKLFDERNVWFVGSAMGAVWLAMAMQWAALRSSRAAYTEKVTGLDVDVDGVATTRMELKRFDLGVNPYVILIEDVLTTGGTTAATMDGIAQRHPDVEFHPDIGVLINRGGLKSLRGHNVVALINVEAHTWDTLDNLPEQMRGCTPVKPKGEWHRLTTEML